jgi:hypothetical protein
MAGSARPTSWSLGRSGGDHAFGAAVSDLTPRGPSAEPDSRRVGSPKPIPWRSGPLGSPGPAPVTSRSLNRRPLQGHSRVFLLHRAWPFVVEHGSLLCAVDRLTAGVWSGWLDAWRVSLSSFPSIDSSRSPGSRCGRWDPGRRLGCGRRIETQFTTRAARVGRTPARDSSRNRAFIDRPGGAQETARSRRIG